MLAAAAPIVFFFFQACFRERKDVPESAGQLCYRTSASAHSVCWEVKIKEALWTVIGGWSPFRGSPRSKF